jgi:FMN-dependent NADH-azoreductase
MAVLRVDASIQGPRSASSELADLVEAEWAVARPGAEVVRRHIGASPLPAQAWADAVRARFVPEDERSSAQRAAVALAEEIARELRSAEAAILALPLYNFGVSQHVKTWMDLAIIGGESGEAAPRRHADRTSSPRGGGAYGAGLPREGWDHNTAYLRRSSVTCGVPT